MAFGASVCQYGERRRIHLCLLITDSVVKNAFIRGREGDNSRTMQRAEEGREGARARDAEALIRGAGSAGRRWGQMELMDLARLQTDPC